MRYIELAWRYQPKDFFLMIYYLPRIGTNVDAQRYTEMDLLQRLLTDGHDSSPASCNVSGILLALFSSLSKSSSAPGQPFFNGFDCSDTDFTSGSRQLRQRRCRRCMNHWSLEVKRWLVKFWAL